MYAPNHHPAMKNVGAVRKEMGVRTLFNILGPLTNPAGASHILMGVFHPDLVGIQVRVLQRLGAGNALVVWGRDGMDEISLAGPTLVGELRDGRVDEYEVEPAQFGFAAVDSAVLRVENPEQSKARVLEALENRAGAAHDIVALNAGVQQQPGFLGAESARGADGLGITVAYFDSEENIRRWRNHTEHAATRERGKREWYEHFEVRVAKVERAYAGP